VVTAVPDLDGAAPVPSPSHHRCSWSRDGQEPTLLVMHAAGPPPKPGEGGRTETIAGRPSFVTSLTGSPQCVVETAHIPFPAGGPAAVERMTVMVGGADGDTVCGSARSVARLAWTTIPPA
jgi:hypothetical protein